MGLLHSSYLTKYLTSLYWTIQTLFVIGFGDVAAITPMEQLVAIIWMLIGVGFYSLTIGDLTTLILEMNKKSAILTQLTNKLNDLSMLCRIPQALQDKVKRFYEINCKLNMFWGMDFVGFLQEIPRYMREEIVLYAYYNLIISVNLFKNNCSFACMLLPKM